MYGQANYGPPFGQGPQPPRAVYQQHQPGPPSPQPPPPPPPPPPTGFHFQQQPQGPPQHVPPGPHLYQHGPPASFPPVHPGPPVQAHPLRAPNASESHRHPHPYASGQQMQHSSHFGAQNSNHNPVVPLPSHVPPRPEMGRFAQPLGALPPPPPQQGQMPHRTAFYPLPPYPDAVQGTKPPPPPPPSPPPILQSSPLVTSSSQSISIHSGSERLNPLSQSEPIEAKTVQGVEDLCTSTADSDMEMEDDITLTDKDQKVDNSTERQVNEEEIGGKEQPNVPHFSPVNILVQDISAEFLNRHRQSEDLTLKSAVKVHSQVIHETDPAELPMDDIPDKTVFLPVNSSSPSGTSVAAEATTSKNHSKFIKAGSPIRLLQDYASDDSSENDDELLHKDMNPSHSKLLTSLADTSSPNKDVSSYLEKDTRSKRSKFSDTNDKAGEHSPTSFREVKVTVGVSISTRISDRCQDNNPGNKEARKDATSHSYLKNKSLDDGGAHDISKRCSIMKENEEKQEASEPASLKVDEFGRLVREGPSDSDSDSGYANRHRRRAKRDRSRSCSWSPLDRRRTNRSSRRRKDKRSRSRSWSPRKPRSRSRSPSYRRAGELSREKIRSNRVRAPECFDFIRGRCYRGASCRYMHHGVGKSDGSTRYRSQQKNPEVPSGTENHKRKKESRNISLEPPGYVHDKTEIQDIQGGRVDLRREDIITDSRQAIISDHIGELIDPGIVNCLSPRGASGSMQEVKITLEKSADPNLQIHDYRNIRGESREQPLIDNFPSKSANNAGILNSRGDTSYVVQPLVKNSIIQTNNSVAEVQDVNSLYHQLDGSSVSDALPNQTTLKSPRNLPDKGSVPNLIVPTGSFPTASSSQSLSSEAVVLQYPAAKELSPPCLGPKPTPRETSQLPPPPPFPPPHNVNSPHMPQLPASYISTAPVAPFPHQSQPYQAPVPIPSNYPWTLPPPPPRPPYDLRYSTGTATPGVSSQFQPSYFPPRNDFGSQASGFLHHSQPSSHEPRQVNLQLEKFSSDNQRIQLGAPESIRENNSSHPTVQDPTALTSSGSRSLHHQLAPSQELPANRMLHGNLPSGQFHPFSQMQVASGHLTYHLGDENVGLPGKSGSISQYLSDLQDRNQSSCNPDFGLPRIVAHHNPYASTFEQPLGSKLSTSVNQDKGPLSANQHDIPVSSRHVKVDGQGVGGYGSRQTTSSSGSARADGNLTRAGGDQYDPLFDSIEPTSAARKQDHCGEKWEAASDSDQREKHSGSNKLGDLEDKSRHEVAAVASTTSLDNDEFGETADAEVGAVENESLSDHFGVVTAAEMETETKSTGKKKKKKKDSRSTKPFKMAIADFVKDVLKPSWRQGNMSKEAFKTIVKKTVDKVSGAMKGHNVPKSRAKIDQYIDSSQRKLTKLVMGYVDKYVKA